MIVGFDSIAAKLATILPPETFGHGSCEICRIHGNFPVDVLSPGGKSQVQVDLIVVTTGMKSVDDLARELDGAVPVTLVGVAKHVGNAQDAITDAYLTCREI